MNVYLDTHVLLFALGPQKRFPKRALSLLRRASSLKLSPASVLELALLREIGRLNAAPHEFIEAVAEVFPVSVCDRPFTSVAQAAVQFSWTRDPFDRLIVAQAHVAECVLLTKDDSIRSNFAHAAWD